MPDQTEDAGRLPTREALERLGAQMRAAWEARIRTADEAAYPFAPADLRHLSPREVTLKWREEHHRIGPETDAYDPDVYEARWGRNLEAWTAAYEAWPSPDRRSWWRRAWDAVADRGGPDA
jgi:hypothetical protein